MRLFQVQAEWGCIGVHHLLLWMKMPLQVARKILWGFLLTVTMMAKAKKGLEQSRIHSEKTGVPYPTAPPPILIGKIITNMKIESVTLAKKSGDDIIPGYLTVTANFSDVCTGLYKKCGPEKIKMLIPQDHLKDIYTDESTADDTSAEIGRARV